jgi:hypothetical protein
VTARASGSAMDRTTPEEMERYEQAAPANQTDDAALLDDQPV